MEAEAFLNELPTVIFSAIKDSSNLLDRFLLPSLASSSTLSSLKVIKDSSNFLDRFLLPSLASSSTLSKRLSLSLSLSLSLETKATL